MIGSIGFPEFILIFVIVLLVVGPNKLPQFAKFLGKSLRLFKDTLNETKKSIREELDKADITEDFKDLKEVSKDFKDLRNINILDDDKK
jgi:Tat protein translocase TatB subunit